MNKTITGISVVDGFINRYLINIIAAVVILLIGFAIGKIVGKLVEKLLKEIELNVLLKKAGMKKPVEKNIGKIVSWLIYFFTFITALKQLGLDIAAFNMIAWAIVIIVLVSVILSVKDYIPNLIAGLSIYKREMIKLGDVIKVQDVKGKVIKISLIETHIQTRKKEIIHIPNSIITKNKVSVKKKK